MKTRPLPNRAAALLAAAPPRLHAHHELVHDVAWRLLEGIQKRFTLPVNVDAVLFGAATHDIGKMFVPAELSQPGSTHESIGESHLLTAGIPPQLARFARTHGFAPEHLPLEDTLVVVADKVWKGQRNAAVEARLVKLLSEAAGQPAWQTFDALDNILERLARDGDRRLEHQSHFATS